MPELNDLNDEDLFFMAREVCAKVEALIPLPEPDTETAAWLGKFASMKPMEWMEHLESQAAEESGAPSRERVRALERHVNQLLDAHHDAVRQTWLQRGKLMRYASIRFYGVENIDISSARPV